MPLQQPTARARDTIIIAAAVAFDLLIWGGEHQLRFGGQAPSWLVPLLTVVVYATLVKRRRYPVEVFALQWVYSLAGLVFDNYGPIAGTLIALHAVASRRSLRTAGPALALCLAPAAINGATEAAHRIHQETPFAISMSLIMLMYFTLFYIVWVLGRLSYTAERRSSRLLQQREAEAREAISAERRRLARELHDIVAHAVTAMMLQTNTASIMIGSDDARARKSLASVQDLGVQAMHELHRLLHLLRAVSPANSPDDDLGESDAPQPGVGEISSLIDIARASGVDARLVVEGSPAPLDRSVQLATYRVVQESLTNAIKHSGGGRSSVSLRWHEQLTVEVRSSAGVESPTISPAIPALSSGHGLMGLSERVSLIGGTFGSGRKGSEFVVTATLPLTTTATQQTFTPP